MTYHFATLQELALFLRSKALTSDEELRKLEAAGFHTKRSRARERLIVERSTWLSAAEIVRDSKVSG
jgi:hypothetical protein